MPVEPEKWVNSHVQYFFKIGETSELPCNDTERKIARRLVTDLRMREVYECAYLNDRLDKAGWHYWFYMAKSTLPSDFKVQREKFKKHTALVAELAYHLEESSRLQMEIRNLRASEVNSPAELRNLVSLVDAAVEDIAAAKNSQLPSIFNAEIRPVFDKLKTFPSRDIPSVGQLLESLSRKISDYSEHLKIVGPLSHDPSINAPLMSRQHAPGPEYIRSFDQLMREGVGSSFLLPPEIMAIQVQVAIDLNSFDKKQVKSARKMSA